ncbi:MAG TPA: MFS transporter [Acidobacteriaceae bacterium]|nr:MFS transporter [Acidobacteriaceae bacterium]
MKSSVAPADPSAEPSALGAQVLLVNACMFVFGIVLLLMGSLLPTLRVSAAHAGSLGSLPLAGVLLATIVIGPVFDKAGAKTILALSLLLVAGALAVMPSLTSYPALAAAAMAYGFGGGILNTATNALVSVLHASSRASSLNLLGFSFSLGAIAAPLLMSVAHGRLSSAAMLHLLAVAPALILLLLLPMPFPPGLRAGTPPRVLLRTLLHPAIWIFAILLLFESANENCVFVWAGKLTADIFPVFSNHADLALVAVTIALGTGRLIASFASHRMASRALLLLSCAVLVSGSAIVAISAHAQAGYAGMVAGFSILGLGMAPIFPTALALAGDRFPSETGTVFGAVMAVALVGGTSGPLLGGWLAAHGPAEVLFVPVAAAFAIAPLTLFAARSRVS